MPGTDREAIPEFGLFDEPEQVPRSPKPPKPAKTVPIGYKPEILPDVDPGPMVVDRERAFSIIDRLLHAYTNDEPPYNHPDSKLPLDEAHMPRTLVRGSTEHAVMLMNDCLYMRGGTKSNDAIRRISTIFDKHPQLFDVEYAAEADPAEVDGALKESGLGLRSKNPKFWVENSRRLRDRYDGDPRNLFEGIDTYDELLGRVMNDGKGGGFLGFREKMVSMLSYFMVHEGMADPFKFPVPVDLHVMRVSLATEMVSFPEAPHGANLWSQRLLAELRGIYMDYAVEKDADPVALSDAIWSLSESACTKHPGNDTEEPLGRKNRDGRNTVLVPATVNIHNRSQQRRYEESCAACPVEDECKWNVPGKLYYVAGALIVRGSRVKFPDPYLF